MSSFVDQITVPYLTSPLANSTKIYNTQIFCYGADVNVAHLYGNGGSLQMPSKMILDQKSITFKDTTIRDVGGEADISTASASTNSSNVTTSSNETSTDKKETRKSVKNKKPLVGCKAASAKKNVEPIRTVSKNSKKTNMTVEKILKEINMTKYQQSFKKIDVEKFKDFKEIDLNAIGITRPSELRIFKEAIQRIKSDS